jgi:hypothetical protein
MIGSPLVVEVAGDKDQIGGRSRRPVNGGNHSHFAVRRFMHELLS